MIAAHTPVSTHPSYNESDYRNTITCGSYLPDVGNGSDTIASNNGLASIPARTMAININIVFITGLFYCFTNRIFHFFVIQTFTI